MLAGLAVALNVRYRLRSQWVNATPWRYVSQGRVEKSPET